MYEETADFFDPSSISEGGGEDHAVAFNGGGDFINPNNDEDDDTHLIHEPPDQALLWDPQQTLSLVHLPRCPNYMNHPLAFEGGGGGGDDDDHHLIPPLPSSSDPFHNPAIFYDHSLPPQVPQPQPQPQPPFYLFQDGGGAHFNGCTAAAAATTLLDAFNGETDVGGGGIRRKPMKTKKPTVSERQRRVEMKGKFSDLKSLVPNPNTKTDRASIVGEACEYIKELQRTVNDLKLLVEKKRFAREIRSKDKRQNNEDDQHEMKPHVADPNAVLRSSWLQRKSKDTEVDVRIVDDEVTIKLAQRKKVDCLLFVPKALDELQLDLQHVSGGHIGDHYSFLFNTKICEGSCVYAGAIANKLIEVMDKQYAAASGAPPIHCTFESEKTMIMN